MVDVNLIPDLRFPEFNENWNQKRFEEIYSFKTTNSYSRDNLNYENGTVKNIHYGDIHTKFNSLFDITEELVPYINEEIDISRISEDSYLQEGDLIIADASEDYNDIGKAIEVFNLNNERVVAGLHTFLARKESSEVIKGFASFLMKTRMVRLAVMKIAQGTKVLGISTGRLAQIPLLIPQPEEQEKITSFLSAVDVRIQLLQKKKAKLEEYKKGVMQKLFSQEIRFKDHNGNDFPDWEEKKLGKIGATFNGLTGKTKVDFGEGMPYVQYMQIFSNSKINVQEFGFVRVDENENQNKVQYGDVFFTTSSETPNEIGTASVMLEEVGDVYLNSFCFGFRPNSLTELVPQFSRYLFRSELFRREVIKLAQGSTRFNMSKVELMKLPVLLPKEEEQNKIADFLTSLDDSIESIGVEIEGSIEYKKGLLQKMFV
ncbi:restriction endonuclease subunit S [Cyclobacterium xiamenense]|uniref:restriction endonuclease subunit S n=1 Tax=Cyclobacterium xiamenense TaxID=1297121 RepID=UPI0012B9DA51|nr:restriction endonuclease subunit S [Cyclobacterium xiamenense]